MFFNFIDGHQAAAGASTAAWGARAFLGARGVGLWGCPSGAGMELLPCPTNPHLFPWTPVGFTAEVGRGDSLPHPYLCWISAGDDNIVWKQWGIRTGKSYFAACIIWEPFLTHPSLRKAPLTLAHLSLHLNYDLFCVGFFCFFRRVIEGGNFFLKILHLRVAGNLKHQLEINVIMRRMCGNNLAGRFGIGWAEEDGSCGDAAGRFHSLPSSPGCSCRFGCLEDFVQPHKYVGLLKLGLYKSLKMHLVIRAN